MVQIFRTDLVAFVGPKKLLSKSDMKTLEVQPPLLVYEPPFLSIFYSKGLSSSKRNHYFLDGGNDFQGDWLSRKTDNSAVAQVHLKPMDEWKREVQAALQDW